VASDAGSDVARIYRDIAEQVRMRLEAEREGARGPAIVFE
jgi:hypothetical protein